MGLGEYRARNYIACGCRSATGACEGKKHCAYAVVFRYYHATIGAEMKAGAPRQELNFIRALTPNHDKFVKGSRNLVPPARDTGAADGGEGGG